MGVYKYQVWLDGYSAPEHTNERGLAEALINSVEFSSCDINFGVGKQKTVHSIDEFDEFHQQLEQADSMHRESYHDSIGRMLRESRMTEEEKHSNFWHISALRNAGEFSRRKEAAVEEMKKDYGDVSDAVDPKHYKEVVPGMQYIEMMQYMLKDYDGVESHLMGQTYKYLMRLGKKDAKVQDAKKAHWYLSELINYLENGEIKL